MRSIIGNKLASYKTKTFLLTKQNKLSKQNTMCWLLYTNLQNKTQYRRTVPFVRLQKCQQKYIDSKGLSELETFPSN